MDLSAPLWPTRRLRHSSGTIPQQHHLQHDHRQRYPSSRKMRLHEAATGLGGKMNNPWQPTPQLWQSVIDRESKLSRPRVLPVRTKKQVMAERDRSGKQAVTSEDATGGRSFDCTETTRRVLVWWVTTKDDQQQKQ